MLHHLKHHLKRLTAPDYEHRQYVILSAVLGVLLLAFTFNRYVLNRSTILLTITQPNVVITVDGERATLERVDAQTYRLVTIPGKHTIAITADGSVNHKQVVQTAAGRTTAVTPALTIAPNPTSNEVGTVEFIAQSPDRRTLYYLGQNGQALVSYDIASGQKRAISDPVFRRITNLSWAPDFGSVIVKNQQDSWYYFDFRKPDFVSTQFVPVADPTYLDIGYDQTPDGQSLSPTNDSSHRRVGWLAYRDRSPVFGIATPGLDNQQVLTVLADLVAPRFSWNPNGNSVALIEESRYTEHNLSLYNLATDVLVHVNEVSTVERLWFSPDGTQLLLATDQSTNNLQLYNLEERSVQTLGTLAVTGAAVWRTDSQTITAILTVDDQPTLVDINLTGEIITRYQTPTVTGEISAFYLNEPADTLLFDQAQTLLTFPLLPPPSTP